MRNYYYNDADMTVYTAREMSKALDKWPECRFHLIGECKSRTAAEDAIEDSREAWYNGLHRK